MQHNKHSLPNNNNINMKEKQTKQYGFEKGHLTEI